MTKQRRQPGIALQTLVSSIIIFSMLILAMALVGLSYFNNRTTLIKQVEHSATLAAKAVDTGIVHLTGPVLQVLQILELDSLATSTTYSERMDRLPVLVRTLEANELISAVYFGYENGDFFLLRRLKNGSSVTPLSYPENAEFMLQSIVRDPQTQETLTHWIFFDKQLNSLTNLNPLTYDFDPRERPWFQDAKTSDKLVVTSPYVFFTTQEVGLTFATRNRQSGAIVGIDASLRDLSEVLAALRPTAQTELALMDSENHVIGYTEAKRLLIEESPGMHHLAGIADLNVQPLEQLAKQTQSPNTLLPIPNQPEPWYGLKLPVGSAYGDWQLLFAVPEEHLFAEVNQHMLIQLVLSIGIIALLVITGWMVGRSVSKPLIQLSKEVSALASYDFDQAITINSNVREVRVLSQLTSHMAIAIRNFQSISTKLARSNDLDMTLDQVAQHLIAITSAETGAVYLLNTNSLELTLATETELDTPQLITSDAESWEVLHDTIQASINAEPKNLFITPLIDRRDKILGALVLLLPERIEDRDVALYHFIEEISGAAATAISTRHQFEAQQELLDGIIKLLADAIDAKSPYTSGHCERVPVLAEMLADAAIDASHGICSDFTMDHKERREFRIAAWLHDCGKIISPEHVIDKATKLETIYNRIHEVRMRFEVLWRDNEIKYLEGILAGKDGKILKQQLENNQQQLQDDFSFIAHCNVGGESMTEEALCRLETLANIQWQRHFRSDIGLAHNELERYLGSDQNLPVTENLLANKHEHIISWGDRCPPVEKNNPENIWGFDMKLPEQAFNHGELYNLKTRRGTLTAEERFVINDHIVQTIRMLTSLPLPSNLSRVPEIAGNHHETLIGTGYPRKLNASELSVAERIMAIADVFEALTANDRPYKEAKKLSEAISIMARLAKEQHIDKELFALFLDADIYSTYAEQFLQEKQKDAIDIHATKQQAGIYETTPA